MRTLIYAKRVAREVLRDPLSIAFGVGFPVVLLVMLNMIQRNVPVEMFELSQLTPGIIVFGMSFLSMFAAQLISRDASTSMLDRMLTTPMRSRDFIFGYTLPLFPMGLAQGVICFALAWILGLTPSWRTILVLLSLLPTAALYIALGLLAASLFSEKTATVFCGTLLTNLSAWLSGTWFSLDLVGSVYKTVAECLPFSHAVDLGRAALTGTLSDALPHLWWVLGYALAATVAAVVCFQNRKMKT